MLYVTSTAEVTLHINTEARSISLKTVVCTKTASQKGFQFGVHRHIDCNKKMATAAVMSADL